MLYFLSITPGLLCLMHKNTKLLYLLVFLLPDVKKFILLHKNKTVNHQDAIFSLKKSLRQLLTVFAVDNLENCGGKKSYC